MSLDTQQTIASSNLVEIPQLHAKQGDLKSGEYVGVLQLDNHYKIPMVLSLIGYRKTSHTVKARAIVKLVNGHANSHEYISQYFLHVNYSFSTKKLTFKGKKLHIRLEKVYYHDQGIRGKVIFNDQEKQAGWFYVKKQTQVPGTIAQLLQKNKIIKQPLTGTYQALCQNSLNILQVETHKNPQATQLREKALTWNVSARLADNKDPGCRDKNHLCLKGIYQGLTKIYEQKLLLRTNYSQLNCSKKENGLDCNSCFYSRKEQELSAKKSQVFPRKYHWNEVGHKLLNNNKPEKVIGEYVGYLHHELLNKYQLVRFAIYEQKKRHKNGQVWQYLYGHSSLFFGDSAEQEFITYNYLPRRYHPQRKVFVFDGESESLFVVTSWHQKGIQGIWYSKTFGRVGSLELKKVKTMDLNKQANPLSHLSGSYKSPQWALKIVAMPEISYGMRDVYPMRVYGLAKDLSKKQSPFKITQGYYDFYTGFYSLRLNDGRSIIGKVDQEQYKFFVPPNESGQKVFGLGWQPFRKDNKSFISIKESVVDSSSLLSLPLEKALEKSRANQVP